MTAITVTGFFYQSSGNIVEVIGKLIRRYVIAGVLPMLEVETTEGRKHVAVEDATIEVPAFDDGGSEDYRYVTEHPTTGARVEIPTHKGKRAGITFATWIRFNVEKLSAEEAAKVNNGEWMLLGTSKARNAKSAAANSRSTNPYGAGYIATPAVDTK